jgi:hemolysin D
MKPGRPNKPGRAGQSGALVKARPAAPPKPIRRKARQPLSDLSALPTPREDRAAGDQDFLPAALEIVETPPSVTQTTLAYAICAIIAAAILWSIFGHLTTYAIASGKILAAGDTKVIEPTMRAQVAAIHFKEGDHVKKGDVLVELNPTDAEAARAIIRDKLVSARAEAARRRVAISAASADPVDPKTAVTWDEDIPQNVREREAGVLEADLSQLAAVLADLAAERKAKEAARDGYTSSVASEKTLIEATTERVGMHQTLETKGWDSRVRVLQAMEPLKEQQVALTDLQGKLADANAAIKVIDSRIVKTRDSFVADNTQKLTAEERQIEGLTQQLAKADLNVRNTKLRAPIDGIVHAPAVTTVGQVVTPGQQIMQVVPEGTPLEIEAYVLNTDIGFVREGQPAVIKVDTFPYTRYGTIAGRVTKVGADALTGEEALARQKNGSAPPVRGVQSQTNPGQQTKDLVFAVTVVPAKSTIDVDGKETALTPGMSVVVEITTGQHRAISYIMYPLMRGLPQSKPQ